MVIFDNAFCSMSELYTILVPGSEYKWFEPLIDWLKDLVFRFECDENNRLVFVLNGKKYPLNFEFNSKVEHVGLSITPVSGRLQKCPVDSVDLLIQGKRYFSCISYQYCRVHIKIDKKIYIRILKEIDSILASSK